MANRLQKTTHQFKVQNMKMNKILSIFTLAVYGIVTFVPAAKSEQVIKDISGKMETYTLPANLGDGVSSFIGINPEKKSILKTPEGLFVDNYSSEKNSDGSTTVKMNVYNQYHLDGLIEIRNLQGQLVRYGESEIKAFKFPENFVESTAQFTTTFSRGINPGTYTLENDPTDLLTSNMSEVKFVLEKGETANITIGSSDALRYNTVGLVFDVVGLALDIGNISGTQKKEIVLDFINNSKYKVSTNLLKKMLSEISSENVNGTDKIKKILSDPSFLLIAEELKKYLIDESQLAIKDVIFGTVSDLITKRIESIYPLFGIVSGVTYTATKSSNVSRKLRQIDNFYTYPKPQIILGAQDENRKSFYGQKPIANSSSDTSILQGQIANIIQSGSSHIGSASIHFPDTTYTQFKATDIPVQNEGSLQAKNTYTNGTIVKAPLDIGLTWNQSTNLDLDSHLVTPNNQHVYFESPGNLSASPNAFLYRDTIPDPGVVTYDAARSRGAEQTRITSFQEGEYRFYVHNYSQSKGTTVGNAAGLNGLSNSSAKVEIFQGGDPLTNNNVANSPDNFDSSNPALQNIGNPYPGNNTFNVPTNQSGNTWYVFKLDTRTGILTKVNRFGNVNNSSNVPNFK